MDADKLLGYLTQAVHDRHWILAAALLLSGLTWCLRLCKRWWPWLGTDRGGVASLVLCSFFGAIAANLRGGHALNLELALDAVGVAVAAAGGWSVIKKTFAPSDKA